MSKLGTTVTTLDNLLRPRPMHQAVLEFKKAFLVRVLQESDSVQKKAATTLQIQATYLNRLVKELGISTKKDPLD